MVTAAEVPAALAALDRLKEVGPQRILCAFDPTAGDGPDALAAFARLQAAYPARLRSRMRRRRRGRSRRGARRRRARRRGRGLRLATVAVCPAVDRQSTPPGSAWPDCPPLEEIYAAARAAFPGVTLGGGMFSYFTELNRKRPPVGLLDFVTHATNPIVHAADDDSVMETLEALPHITRSTRAIIGDAALPDRALDDRDAAEPLWVAHDPEPQGRAGGDGGRRPAPARAVRGRLDGGLCGGDRPGGVAVWVPAAFTGPRGLLDADGALLPVGEVVRDLARLAGSRRCSLRGRSCRGGSRCLRSVTASDDAGGVVANLAAVRSSSRCELGGRSNARSRWQ